MPERELVYPNYSAEVIEGGDIRLCFVVPGSKFGAVSVVLVQDDAEGFVVAIDRVLLSDEAVARAAGLAAAP